MGTAGKWVKVFWTTEFPPTQVFTLCPGLSVPCDVYRHTPCMSSSCPWFPIFSSSMLALHHLAQFLTILVDYISLLMFQIQHAQTQLCTLESIKKKKKKSLCFSSFLFFLSFFFSAALFLLRWGFGHVFLTKVEGDKELEGEWEWFCNVTIFKRLVFCAFSLGFFLAGIREDRKSVV